MNDYNISISNKLNEQLNHYEYLGQTAMMIAVDNQINGIIAVADTVKNDAKQAIKDKKYEYRRGYADW